MMKHNFNLNYAPHFGSFEHSADKDPIDSKEGIEGEKALLEAYLEVDNFVP